MSVKELLNRFKQLKPEQQARFLRDARALKQGRTRPTPKPKKPDWSGIEARAKALTGNKELPNLVLLAREESAF